MGGGGRNYDYAVARRRACRVSEITGGIKPTAACRLLPCTPGPIAGDNRASLESRGRAPIPPPAAGPVVASLRVLRVSVRRAVFSGGFSPRGPYFA